MKGLGLLAALLVGACDGGTTWLGAQTVGDGGGAGAVPPNFFMRYEAESSANTLTYPVEHVSTDSDVTCPPNGVKEGANCASGGTFVRWIMGRSPCEPPTSMESNDNCQNLGGGVRFDEVIVPADGIYDVTWWYHCGVDPPAPNQADVRGDKNCGGLDYKTGIGSGCRSQLIDVNGAPISSTAAGGLALYFHFPCYVSPRSVIHGATTSLPLKAGTNSIYLHAPPAMTLDAVDIDALDVQAAGHGTAAEPLWPKLVTPAVSAN